LNKAYHRILESLIFSLSKFICCFQISGFSFKIYSSRNKERLVLS